jgi:2-dehydro-3-deoxygluconokinase
VDALRARTDLLVAIDPHDHITADSLASWRRVLDGVDVLFVSEHEIALAELGDNLRAALMRLAGGRLHEILLKRGAAGGVLFDVRADRLTPWKAAPATVVDPTGAGDAFAGAYLAARLQGISPAQALARGAVSASLAIEAWGADGLLRASRADAERRLGRDAP